MQVHSRQLDEAEEENERSVGLINKRMGRTSHAGRH